MTENDNTNMTNVPNAPTSTPHVVHKEKNNWIKYVCTMIIILIISICFMRYEDNNNTIQKGLCSQMAEDALNFANNSYYFQANNFTCFTPDQVNALNNYLNLSYKYYQCMQGIY